VNKGHSAEKPIALSDGKEEKALATEVRVPMDLKT